MLAPAPAQQQTYLQPPQQYPYQPPPQIISPQDASKPYTQVIIKGYSETCHSRSLFWTAICPVRPPDFYGHFSLKILCQVLLYYRGCNRFFVESKGLILCVHLLHTPEVCCYNHHLNTVLSLYSLFRGHKYVILSKHNIQSGYT